MRFGLVLGADGVVGLSYHAGVVHALAEEGGIDPASADLIVGTSAGSVVATLLRSGWSARDCWHYAHEEHPVLAQLDEAERARRKAAMFAMPAESAAQRACRVVGSAFIATRAVVKAPIPNVPEFLARRFPAGVFDNQEMRSQVAEVVGESWPDDELWLVAVDVETGRRVVLRKRDGTRASVRDAVMASCAIPGAFPPVRVGRHLLVDGGAHSSTHLDLAATRGCDLIIGVAPMAFDPGRAPSTMSQLVRRAATRALAREAASARSRGATVLLVRPGADELQIHGRDMMRPSDTGAIARAAYESTARLLQTPRFRRVLDGGRDRIAA